MTSGVPFITRRDFLAIAAASVAGAALFQLLHSTGCCHAVVRTVNVYGCDRRSYCPNCGRDILEKTFRLATGGESKGWNLGRWRRNGWNPAQVPFPNLLLVERTNKATVLMSKVRLQGLTRS